MVENSNLTFGETLSQPSRSEKKPAWLKVKLPTSQPYQQMKALLADLDLHTVCESAACPNRGECWSKSTATFMILGNICTRSCRFCNVITGRPTELDDQEPERIGLAIQKLKLGYAVITSVNRDELKDGGASIWAETINQIRLKSPSTKIEILIPDFLGNWQALAVVLAAKPDLLNHNIETVPRLYREVRPQGKFDRSLELLRQAKLSGLPTKSGLMLGLGESDHEVIEAMEALRLVDCDMLTLGQYLQPTSNHLPVARWVHPQLFQEFHKQGMNMGFKNVFAGPLVRSSYHAEEHGQALKSKLAYLEGT